MASTLGPDLLPPDLNQRLQSEMHAGERVAWSARPRASSGVLPSLALVVFGLFFGGMPLVFFVLPAFGLGFLTGQHAGGGPPVFFGLFGMIFVVIGFAMMTSPLWIWRSNGRTVYAVTNQRAIVLKPAFFGGTTVQSFLPDRLTSMTRTERANGSGHLIFEQFTERVGTGSRTVRRGFVGIERVRDVENLILTTLVQNRTRGM